MENLSKLIDSVDSRDGLVRVIEALRQDLKKNPEKWENDDLDSYLDAMGGWVDSMDGYFKNMGLPFSEQQSWQLMAMILHAATAYE